MTPTMPPRVMTSTHPAQRPHSVFATTPGTPDERPRFLSEADCHDIAQRLARCARGGGFTIATIQSTWTGSVRWARNQVVTAGEDRNDHVAVTRSVRGAKDGFVIINETTDTALVAAVRRAERLAGLQREGLEADLLPHVVFESFASPALFDAATYQLDADHRADAAHRLAQSAAAAGMLSAGYLAVSAHSLALITSWGYARYFQYTWAQYSVTVRDPTGTGSGWAGVDWPEWTKIDGPTLSAIALDKCVRSRNPVAIEPGRYTTILEPQAVCDFVGPLVFGHWGPPIEFQALDRYRNEGEEKAPFNQRPADDTGAGGRSRLGERVVDERITLTTDPMDPELGFPPFELNSRGWNGSQVVDQYVYHPATWIERGVLTNLAYSRFYAVDALGRDTGLPLEGAFQMSGGDTAIEEMIATTARGLLVTRFDRVRPLDLKSLLQRGYTRDGLWLIEQGKLSKPVKNMVFTESILGALNSVEQLGMPQRVYHPPGPWYDELPQPVVVPPLKIRDFSFTSLSGAV